MVPPPPAERRAPPRIFAANRRLAARRRMVRLMSEPSAARFVLDDMVEDVLDRLSFLRPEGRRAVVIGDVNGQLGTALTAQGYTVDQRDVLDGFDYELPHAHIFAPDLIVSLGVLDTVNDLPGALIHLRGALRSGGLMIASFMAAGSLPRLREAMLAADGDRPAAHFHPAVDVRAGGELLQRTGFANPVVDQRGMNVSYAAMDRLIGDIRAQGLSSVLADHAPPVGKAGLVRARAAFAAAGTDGRTIERFEILTLSGWKA